MADWLDALGALPRITVTITGVYGAPSWALLDGLPLAVTNKGRVAHALVGGVSRCGLRVTWTGVTPEDIADHGIAVCKRCAGRVGDG